MNILLLSAYNAASHQYWHKGLLEHFPEHSWEVLVLPGRYFNWRIRGNALSWSFLNSQQLKRSYDLIIATSMVDLSTLKGLNPSLAQVPSIVYFHENQFAYPETERQTQCAEAKMVNLYSALCADKIVFNSSFNQNSFLTGVESFLKKMPDYVPDTIQQSLFKKSQVVPVPLENRLFEMEVGEKSQQQLTLVWNHRWEYDKGPECLYEVLTHLVAMEVDFKIHILGECFRKQPKVFQEIKNKFERYIGCYGFVKSKQEYYQILQQSHLALSTSIHEFQGLAVMEAVSQRAIPVVPNRLSYQEIFPSQYRYDVFSDIQQEAYAMAGMIAGYATVFKQKQLPAPLDMRPYSWAQQKGNYKRLIELFG